MCLLLGSFPSVAFILSNFGVIVFVISYILFCYILLISFRDLFFSSERQKGVGSRWKLGWEGGERKGNYYQNI